MKMEDEKKQNFKYKCCPFRKEHFCGNCEWLQPGIDKCVLICLNANIGTIAKALHKITKTEDFIKELQNK